MKSRQLICLQFKLLHTIYLLLEHIVSFILVIVVAQVDSIKILRNLMLF